MPQKSPLGDLGVNKLFFGCLRTQVRNIALYLYPNVKNTLCKKVMEQTVINERILLCRPLGGLNDMLAQIEKCYRYALKYNRKLFIDGSRGGFRDDFARYFIPAPHIFFEKIDFLSPPFDVFPPHLRDDIYHYELSYWDNNLLGLPTFFITFDFKHDYEEQILVHESAGGGIFSIFALTRLRLKPEIRLHITTIIRGLQELEKSGKYDGIHIRNTDYKTDYPSYFNKIKNRINKTTVISTDDYECQQYAQSFFGEKLKIVTDIPDLSIANRDNRLPDNRLPDNRLHGNLNLDRYKSNVDTLADLFILAYSDHLFYTASSKKSISGFSLLARNLHRCKHITRNMLYNEKSTEEYFQDMSVRWYEYLSFFFFKIYLIMRRILVNNLNK